MKKYLTVLFYALALTGVAKASVMENVPIILSGKIDNPNGGNGGLGKMPATPLQIFQSDHVFLFGEPFVGCAVSLLSNNVAVFSTVVDEDGQVTIPETFSGTYELQLVVGNIVYWAMVEL